MKEITELVRQHPFTEGLEPEIVSLMAGCAKNVVFEPEQYVFREGDDVEFFYLIRHGTVALEMFVPGQGALNILTVKSGEILGLNWLIPPYRWFHDARVIELTRAIGFECHCLRDKCEADHHVGYELMKRFIPPLIERLRMARIQSADVYGVGKPE